MHLSFYHLTQNPFLSAPAPEFLFLSPSHKAALQTLMDGIEERRGFVAIVGEAGLGKTTLLRAYLGSIDQQRVKTISLSGTRLSLRDMLAMLCQAFGLESAIDDLAVMTDRLRRLLIEANTQSQKAVLIIDNAHNLPVQTLWNLRMLSDLMETDAGQLVQIVLMGRTEFEQQCNLPELRQLKQRLIMRSTLSPLTQQESMAYIQHRLAKVALQEDPVFTQRALTQIVKHAKGVPRVLNALCAEVLMAGVVSQRKPISAKIAQGVIADFEGKRASPRLRWGFAGSAGLLLLVGLLGTSAYETLVLPTITNLQFKYAHIDETETLSAPGAVQEKDSPAPLRSTVTQPLADASSQVKELEDLPAWKRYRDEGEKAYRQDRYAEAERSFVTALQVADELGARDPRLATNLNRLVTAYRDQGQNAQAEQLLQRTLAIREKALGPEDSFIAMDLSTLAGLYHAQGRYTKAEAFYRRALAIDQRRLGPEHPHVAIDLNNLAGLYYKQSRYARAASLYQEALAIDQKHLGPEHPHVAISLNNIALLYEAQGRYAEAEPLYKRALIIKEKTLGLEHPSLATSLSNLAALYEAQRRYAEAEPLYLRALTIKEKTLGLEHPSLATSLSNLAVLYRVQDRYAEAESLYQRALAISEKTRGPEHPDVATNLSNLGVLYHIQGNYAQAEALYRQALAINQKRLGLEHPDVAIDLENYAILLQQTGRTAKAAELEAHAKDIRARRTLSINEADKDISIDEMENLIQTFLKTGQLTRTH